MDIRRRPRRPCGQSTPSTPRGGSHVLPVLAVPAACQKAVYAVYAVYATRDRSEPRDYPIQGSGRLPERFCGYPSTTMSVVQDSLGDILNRFVQTPLLLEKLTLAKVHTFIIHAARLKNDIQLAQPSSVSHTDIPAFLPASVQAFLSELTDIPILLVPHCWTVLKDLVWNAQYVSALTEGVEAGFMRHGISKGLGAFSVVFPF